MRYYFFLLALSAALVSADFPDKCPTPPAGYSYNGGSKPKKDDFTTYCKWVMFNEQSLSPQSDQLLVTGKGLIVSVALIN